MTSDDLDLNSGRVILLQRTKRPAITTSGILLTGTAEDSVVYGVVASADTTDLMCRGAVYNPLHVIGTVTLNDGVFDFIRKRDVLATFSRDLVPE